MASFTHEDAVKKHEYATPTVSGSDSADDIDTTKATEFLDILAGSGDDIINVASGGNVYGQDGNDVISTYPTNIVTDLYTPYTPTFLYGGNGNDQITITSQGLYNLWGGEGDDKLNGSSGGEYINGEAGNDTLNGNDGNDTLVGGAGNDAISGGNSNDHIIGGEGIDTAFFNIASTDISAYNQKNGVITIKSSEGTDTIEGIERFTFSDKTIVLADMDDALSDVLGEEFFVNSYSLNVTGNNGDDTFNVNTYFNEHSVIDAKAGNDLIYYQRSGSSEVDGGEGQDTVAYDSNDSFVDAYLESNNTVTIFNYSKIVTITNVETIAFNNASYSLNEFKNAFSSKRLDASTIVGTIDADNLTGTKEDDTFFPFISVDFTGGRDVLDGREGNDTAILSIATSDVDSYLNQNGETQISSGGSHQYTLKNIEKLKFKDTTLSLSDLDNLFVKVNIQDQVIFGSNGNDKLFHGLGNDNVDGLDGVDTIVMNTDSSRITQFTQNNDTITLVEQSETDTFENIEYFEFNDVTIAKADLKTVFATVNTEASTFYTTTIDDTFVGGLNNDTVVLDISTEDVQRFSYEKPDFYLWGEFNPDLNIEITSKSGVDSFSHIENFQFIDQTLTSDELLSIFRRVRVEDQYIYTSGHSDQVIFGGYGPDRIYGSFGNDSLHGNDGADTLYGGPEHFNSGTGNDSIFGGAGNDTVYAGDGVNHVDGGEGTDTVVLPFATTEVSIYGVINGEVQFDANGIASYKIKNVENYQFTDKTLTNNDDLDSLFAHVSYNDQTVTGTDGDDQGLAGGEGNNTIIPKLGNDTVYGRSGHDTVVFNIASSEVTSFTAQGITVTFVSPEGTDEIINVDSFQFTEKTFTFNELSAAFASVNTASQTLFGTNDGDELTGGLGDDIINSSNGNDAIDGGADGKDILAFHITKDEISAYSNDNGVITLTYSGSVDTISNIDFFQFTDVSIDFASFDATFAHVNTADQSIIGDDQDNVLSGGLGDDTFTPQAGDDKVDGVSGSDTAIINIDSSKVTGYSNDGINVVITSAEGDDTFSNIDIFKFNDKTLSYADLDQAFSAVTVTSKTLVGDENNNTLTGALANDTITPGKGNDVIDGAAGVDTAVFNVATSDVKALSYSDEKVIITSKEGIDEFTNVELFRFSDKEVTLENLQQVFASVITDDQIIEGNEIANTLLGALGNDTITPKGGDDTVDGAEGEDTAVLNIESTSVTAYSINGDIVTISSPEGSDRFEHIENFKFTDATIKLQDLDSVLSAALVKDQTFTSTTGNDVFEGSEGNDTVAFGYATTDLESVTKVGESYTITGTEGADTISKVETLAFTDRTLPITDLLLGSEQAETINGTSKSDIIDAGKGLDSIHAGNGDDLIISAELGEHIDGGLGLDLVKYIIASTDITSVMRKLDGSIELATAQSSSTLESIESIAFTDINAIDIDNYINSQNPLKPSFNAIVNGRSIAATPEEYKGGVDFLEFQLLGDAEGNIVTGSAFNDFLNLLDGDDAANGGAGRDVLDGGTGSNFLTGGADADTFFLDGRGGTTTWSTITDFDGDNVNIWGWKEGVSKLIQSVENAGADGFKGATFHFDLNNDGDIDTSITFSGLTLSEVPESVANIVEDNGYLLFV